MTVPPWLFLDLDSSHFIHFARVLGPCLGFRGFHFDRGAHVRRMPCVRPLCVEIGCGWALYMSDSGRVTLWCTLQVANHVVGILDDRASRSSWTLILVILPVFWVPAWSFGGFSSTVQQPLCEESFVYE